VAVAGATALVVLVVITLRIVSANASGCSGGVGLRVTASPEIAPSLEDVANAWMTSRPEVGGVCVDVTVEAVGSSTVASRLTVFAGRGIDIAAAPEPTPSESALPAVWVPDSTAWLTRVREIDGAAFVDGAQSIASSPVVLAMPEAAARQLGWPDKSLDVASLKALLTPPGRTGAVLKLGISEPRRETAGLAAAMLLDDTLASSDDDLPALVATLRGIVKTSGTGELLRTFSDQMNAGPASEQSVLAFDADKPSVRLAPVSLNPPAAVLDYPYAVRTGVPQAVAEAAALFRSALAEPSALARLAAKGFRSPDGQIGPGFPATTAKNLDPNSLTIIDDQDRVDHAIGLWTAANSASRTLALFDVTASMASPMQISSGLATRTDAMVAATQGGLSLFAADSQVGMWTFAAGHKEIVPISTLSADQKADIGRGLVGARPTASDQDDLYATLLAAYKVVKDGYDPARPNLIIVLTDGGDSDTSALAQAQFNQSVQKLADSTRPIRVVLIGIGADQPNAANLETIAGIVGGGYFTLTSPEQIQTIFLKALLQVSNP
jgi:hypothetical protein